MKSRPRLRKSNPVEVALLRASYRVELNRLRTLADLQAFAGNHIENLVDCAGRMLFITADAVSKKPGADQNPDVSVLRGMGEALGDLVKDRRMEFHRPAIQAGLMAIERLLPSLDPIDLANATAGLESMLTETDAIGTAELRRMLQPSTDHTAS